MKGSAACQFYLGKKKGKIKEREKEKEREGGGMRTSLCHNLMSICPALTIVVIVATGY